MGKIFPADSTVIS